MELVRIKGLGGRVSLLAQCNKLHASIDGIKLVINMYGIFGNKCLSKF